MLKPSEWTLDIAALNKGDVIEEKTLVELAGVRSNHPDFRLEALNVKGHIKRELMRAGKDWVLRCHHKTLRILTDAEAADFLPRKQSGKRRGWENSHREQVAVDVSKLTADQRRSHERSVQYNAMLLAAVDDTTKEARRAVYQRNTPGRIELPEGV